MNIHPLFVHFPIALLVMYVLLVLAAPWLKHRIAGYNKIKLFLLFSGTLALYPTLITGSLAAAIVGENDLIETHETMAAVTTLLFSTLAGVHLLNILTDINFVKSLSDKYRAIANLLRYLHIIKGILLKPCIYTIVVTLALIAVTITGALGASIVYGPQVDPFVNFVYNIFL